MNTVTKRSFALICIAYLCLSGALIAKNPAQTVYMLPNQQKIQVNWIDSLCDGLSISKNGILKEDANSTVSYTKYMDVEEITIESLVFGTYMYNKTSQKFETSDFSSSQNDAVEVQESDEYNKRLKTPSVAATDTTAVIDVMFVYPVETKTLLGGVSGVIAKATHCVTNTNNAYNNSGIKSKVRLVQVAEINYQTGATLSSELPLLRSTTDGKMDEIHAMRNEAGADIVCLLTDKDSQNSKGIAYILSSESGSPTNGFLVVHYAQAEGIFLHELGHNLGCNHNIEYGGSKLYSYSFGNHFMHNGVERGTLMSYIGQRCSRFAGLESKWEGTVTGNATTADVARTINQSGYILAKYRNSRSIIDFSVRVDSINKSSIKCTVSNKVATPASKSQLTINLPAKCIISDISNTDLVHYNQQLKVIEIDSLKANETKTFTINLNIDSLELANYTLSASLKNMSANHVDINPADNSFQTKISLGAVATGISNNKVFSERDFKIHQLAFSENTVIETNKLLNISIHDINGRICFNKIILGSYIIGSELSKGVYILTATYLNTIKRYKLLKY